MTTSLTVRGLDEDLIRRLKIRAARNNRSAEAEHREILRRALEGEPEPPRPDREALIRLMEEVRKMTEGRTHTPSEVLQREGRDER